MSLYDGSFRDVARRLRDDELISLKLVNEAADMIERFGYALEAIELLFESHIITEIDKALRPSV